MRELRESGSDSLLVAALSVLQLHTINEALLPNLKTLQLTKVHRLFIQFIPSFLSLGVTSIYLSFKSHCPEVMVASLVSSSPTLCPHLQQITVISLPDGPTITAAVSGMVLATNRNTLQELRLYHPLTEEASEVIFKLPNLRSLSAEIRRETSLSSASLPNLTNLVLSTYGNNWARLFHGATFGKLEVFEFYHRPEEIGDLLETFERVALSSSIQNTLSTFNLFTIRSWNPNYSSLLPFTQLVRLDIEFSCGNECSSKVDDDVIVNLSRAMPKLTYLQLGNDPCKEFTTGATTKGLVALALHCPDLKYICIHFQVASLSTPPASPGTGRNTGPTGSWTDCALTGLSIGATRVPEESALIVALTLLRIFPRIRDMKPKNGWYADWEKDKGWKKVGDAIRLSGQIVDCSSKQQPLTTLK